MKSTKSFGGKRKVEVLKGFRRPVGAGMASTLQHLTDDNQKPP